MTTNGELARSRLEQVVQARAVELAGDAGGDVLHLGACPPGLDMPGATSVRHLVHPAELASVGPVDTIVSVCALWRPGWGPDELAGLACRLRPGGRLLLVEPVAVTGASGLAQRIVGRATPPARRRIGFDRPLLDDLRAAGLLPVRVERVCPSPLGRVRAFVVGTALRR